MSIFSPGIVSRCEREKFNEIKLTPRANSMGWARDVLMAPKKMKIYIKFCCERTGRKWAFIFVIALVWLKDLGNTLCVSLPINLTSTDKAQWESNVYLMEDY